ncbi:interferon-induced protein 44-like [Fundulus heteroclitus]|uniref:interferon-induced protein 44-like n=1 Tax=Fundulus heteroclitus TaxID=8078 RepID=UPI00165B2B6B|nr:interferon-induced protein 44-like [Fundulus heteroclitus]
MFQGLFKQPFEVKEYEPSALLDRPWRELYWGNVQEDRQYVQEYKPAQDDIRYLRVLLYGPVGAGRSSFINSVSNVMRGRMSTPALACAGFLPFTKTK